jgi:hypothetical protein
MQQPRLRGAWRRVRELTPRVSVAVDANRAFLLLLHDPGSITAGPLTYHRFWFRDSAFMLNALDYYGFHDEVAQVLQEYLDGELDEVATLEVERSLAGGLPAAPSSSSSQVVDPRGVSPDSPNPLLGLNFFVDRESPSWLQWQSFRAEGDTAMTTGEVNRVKVKREDIPESVIGFLHGELGEPPGGWPEPPRPGRTSCGAASPPSNSTVRRCS